MTFHPYAYAHANPINRMDPSGTMTLGEINTAMGNLASMSRGAVNLMQFINKAQNFMDVIHAIKTIGMIAEGTMSPGGFGNYLSGSQDALKLFDVHDAIDKLQSNLPRILGRAFPEWATYLATTVRRSEGTWLTYQIRPSL